jgi:hypothetical protein
VSILDRLFTPPDTEEQIAEWLSLHCRPWLKAANGEVAYRGVADHIVDWKVKPVRKDRMSTNTPEEYHEVLQDVIKSHGFTANRTNSLFVTGDVEQARDYGTPCVAIPVGYFHYTWFGCTRDPYTMITNHSGLNGKPSLPPEEIEAMLWNLDVRGDDKRGTLQDAINSGHEIMVECDKVALINAYRWSKIVEHLEF